MAAITVPEFNSEAFDTLTLQLSRLEGLAACCASLTHADAEGVLRHVLTDKALYELALTMQDLARTSFTAAETLWDQYAAASKLLGEAGHA
jgi:hypothetical protein